MRDMRYTNGTENGKRVYITYERYSTYATAMRSANATKRLAPCSDSWDCQCESDG